ncbi:hypothetical protein Tco_0203057, partial [Tanacetum coccineum]
GGDCGVEVVAAVAWTGGAGCVGSGDGDVVVYDLNGGVMVAAVGRQPEELEARNGEWIWGSGRSGHEDSIWFRPKRSPKNFFGGGDVVAGGGWPTGRVAGKYGEDGEILYMCVYNLRWK